MSDQEWIDKFAIQELIYSHCDAITRGDLMARRDSALDTLLHLDADGTKKFRPLKESYDAEMKKIAEQRLALMKEFMAAHDKLTAQTAKQMADRAFQLEDARNAVRRKYFERMSAEVSPVAAVQFLQLQRQFETMADLKAATNTPLATP